MDCATNSETRFIETEIEDCDVVVEGIEDIAIGVHDVVYIVDITMNLLCLDSYFAIMAGNNTILTVLSYLQYLTIT